MKHLSVPLAIAALLLAGAGCGPAPETPPAADTTAETAPAEAVEAATSTPEETNANTNAPAAAPKTSGTKANGSSAIRKNFYVEFDDNGAYPGSGTAAKGSTVTVTFKVRTTNVFYNNLIVKSSRHDLGKIDAGSAETITFTATEDETFVAQWGTGQTKARWTLIVR